MDISFGPYRLKRQERVLSGPDGPVDLSARSFDILCTLLEKPGEVIGKDALFAAVWPGVVVEENTLQVHVSALRKALDPSHIVTAHGRGYRYAGPVPIEQGALAATVIAVQLDRKPAIVVLPFENLSNDPEQQYFSDGIAGDITDRLTRFRVLSVIGQHSAAAFRGEAPDFGAIRERLKVEFVVTGSLRRAADRIRIAVRLSSAATGEAIWAERYDRPITDLFGLQDEISELVAATVARYLEVQINVRNTARAHTSFSSYEHKLQGYWHFKKLTRDGNQVARTCFERAVTLDPGNAEAIAWLGVTYCEQWVQDFSVENAARGLELTASAIALDPADATIHAIHTWALLCVGDLPAALKVSERGLQLNPGEPAMMVNRALALGYDGRLQEADELMRLAHRLEPIPPLWFGEFTGVLAFAAGRYDETLAGVEPVPGAAWDVMYALACYGFLGDAESARTTLARLAADGRSPDWELGISREPYKDANVRERLIDGLKMALAWGPE